MKNRITLHWKNTGHWTESWTSQGEWFSLYRPHYSPERRAWYCQRHFRIVQAFGMWYGPNQFEEYIELWKRDIVPMHTTLGKIVFALELNEK